MTEKRSRRFLTMVTNDDGVQSPGIIALAKAVERFSAAVVVAPEGPQSAAGMSLTFHKPLRVNRVMVGGREHSSVSGSPADCVMVGINRILPRRPDAVVSGINIGDNVTIQDVLASGTVAAALEAALMGIPAVAFSMDVPEDRTFQLGSEYAEFAGAAEVAAEITREVLEGGLPRGVDMLNVNFPLGAGRKTPIKITQIERRKYKDYVIERKDPRGRAYYWLWGARLPLLRKDSDAYALHKRHAISVSPVSLSFSSPADEGVERLGERIRARMEERRAADGIKHK